MQNHDFYQVNKHLATWLTDSVTDIKVRAPLLVSLHVFSFQPFSAVFSRFSNPVHFLPHFPAEPVCILSQLVLDESEEMVNQSDLCIEIFGFCNKDVRFCIETGDSILHRR